MSLALKSGLTAVTIILAALLVFWNGSPIHADQRWLVIALAVFTIVTLWGYPKVRL